MGGYMVGIILPKKGRRVNVNYWIGQKRRETRQHVQHVQTDQWCQNQFVYSYTVSCICWQSCAVNDVSSRAKRNFHSRCPPYLMDLISFIRNHHCHWCRLRSSSARAVVCMWSRSLESSVAISAPSTRNIDSLMSRSLRYCPCISVV